MSVLGFYDFTGYPGCGDFESNCGISDQILEMHWIHDNIVAFGGDPDNVTINGESAGSATMDFHFSQSIFKDEQEELIHALTAEIHGSWVRFAKTGDPNPDWVRFAGYDSPVRIFDRESKTVRMDRTELMRVWNDMRFYED